MSERAENDEPRLFDVPASTVVGGVGCVYCCVGVGVPCRSKAGGLKIPHAQRWYEYHNDDQSDQIRIYTAYGKQANRIPRVTSEP